MTKTSRTGGAPPPKPKPTTKPKGYTAKDISDKVNKRLDEE